MKLSFCIPTRNRADIICNTLDSIIEQSNDQIEIIVVDGASQDNTENVIDFSDQKITAKKQWDDAKTSSGGIISFGWHF